MLPAGPMMISARPIVTSEQKGPIHGYIVIGRYLDAMEVKRFENMMRLRLALQPLQRRRFLPISERRARRLQKSPAKQNFCRAAQRRNCSALTPFSTMFSASPRF